LKARHIILLPLVGTTRTHTFNALRTKRLAAHTRLGKSQLAHHAVHRLPTHTDPVSATIRYPRTCSRGSRHMALTFSRRSGHPDTGQPRGGLLILGSGRRTQRPTVERGSPKATDRRPMLSPISPRTSPTATTGLAFFLEPEWLGPDHLPTAQDQIRASGADPPLHQASLLADRYLAEGAQTPGPSACRHTSG
jgi:hypothetical protein